MGYTHYWYRQKTINTKAYQAIVDDFKKIVPVLEREGVKLAGGLGEGSPETDYDNVWFNGVRNCGHPVNTEICIAWATPEAQGIGTSLSDVDGQWLAGRYLTKRCCDGDCSHETFSFPRVFEPGDWQKPRNGKWFDFCKTAFKPYDWAVTVFLLIAKHYLSDRLVIRSDGTSANWQDARLLCQIELGYGLSFQLDTEGA